MMLRGSIIICLAATSYVSASTEVIEHIISSFDEYSKLVIEDALERCMKFSTLIRTYSDTVDDKLFCKTVPIDFTCEYLPVPIDFTCESLKAKFCLHSLFCEKHANLIYKRESTRVM